jgi:hypothetical protein
MERVKDLNMDEEQMMKDIQKGRYNHSIFYVPERSFMHLIVSC